MQISNPYLSKYILPLINGETVLDVGCGAGLYGYLLKYSWYRCGANKKFKQVDAVEFSEETVKELTKMHLYDNIFQTNAATLPLSDNSYDVVMSIECLEHLYKEDLETAIKELYRVSKDILIISTPPMGLCGNARWCIEEIDRIKKENKFITYDEYNEYINTLHKCCVDTDVFVKMGFQTFGSINDKNELIVDNIEKETRIYLGRKEKIDIDKFYISHATNKKNIINIKDKNYQEEMIEALMEQAEIDRIK